MSIIEYSTNHQPQRRAGDSLRDAPPLSEHAREVAYGRGLNRKSLRARLRAEVMTTPVVADVVPGVILALILVGSPWYALVAVLVTCMLNAHAGLYRRRFSLSALDEVPALAGRVVVGCSTAETLSVLRGQPNDSGRLLMLVVMWGAAAFCLRAVGYQRVRRRRRQRRHTQNALIVGAGRVGQQLGRNLLVHPDYGLHPVGMVDDDPFTGGELDSSGPTVPVLGGQRDLVRLVLEHDVQTVIFAFTSARESELVDLIRSCDRVDCEIYLVPRLFEFNTRLATGDFIWGLPVMKLARPAFRSPTRWTKRLLDLVLAVLALVVLAPMMVAVAVAVWFETGGVLFRQQRVGLDGRVFDVLKFQSLQPIDDVEAQTRWNVANDNRLGPIGRFVRSTSLDELPQIWNVLVGDMSFVGPRPERPHFVREFSQTFPQYSARNRVAAGVTGWAQIHSLRGDTSIAERANFDNYYIEHWSAWGDFKILLRTVPAILLRHGQ